MALALSHFIIHPAVAVLLSDRKLNQAADGLVGLGDVLTQVGTDVASSLMSALCSSATSRRFRPA